MSLTFDALFEALHDQKPYAWQRRLSTEVIEKGWPKVIAAPTGAGKTAVLDVALFHLAVEGRADSRKAPRRIVFAVDRRLVVDQAFERALCIQQRLELAREGPLHEMQERLRALAGGAGEALHVEELRGGMPREDDWARTPLQPAILCTTVDQLGSRLFFRGYGVSPAMAPVHAGLLGNDTLIILDEAHLSAAFAETVERAEVLRRTADKPLGLPFAITSLTATPRNAEGAFRLKDEELDEAAISRRLSARKLTRLHKVAAGAAKPEPDPEPNHQSGEDGEAADDTPSRNRRPDPTPFVAAAQDLLGSALTIAIVVNRVALARAIRERLCVKSGDGTAPSPADAILLTGRARPAERDQLIARYRQRLEGRAGGDKPLIVVATQCIEAGADFDFDALVTQIAPLDALAQRFGRLARSGERDGRPARAVVVALPSDLKAKDDPVYGSRMKATWEWLSARTTSRDDAMSAPAPRKGKLASSEPVIDLGPNALAAHIAGDADAARSCCTQASRPPVLRSADLDFWAMTNPRPHPDPHLPLYLHGDPRIETEVSIVWRADLSESDLEDESRAVDIVTAMPPRPGEALQLPIAAARALLSGARRADGADVPARSDDSDDSESPGGRKALAWRGRQSGVVAARGVRPGDTLIVPAGYGGCDLFGWLPEIREPIDPVEDIADLAAKPYASRRLALRLHPGLWPHAVASAGEDSQGATAPWSSIAALLAELPKRPQQIKGWVDRVLEALDTKGGGETVGLPFEKLAGRLQDLKMRRALRLLTPYRIVEGEVPEGVVIVTGAEAAASDDDDASSFRGQPQSLVDHVANVEREAAHYARALGLAGPLARALALAARHHDDGKCDRRFQEFLRAVTKDAAAAFTGDLAKSGFRASRAEEQRLREIAGLPKHWRHEVLSAQLFAQRSAGQEETREVLDLALWLIGTHHGQGRPFFTHNDPWDRVARQVGSETLAAAPGPHHLDFDWHGDAWADLFETLKRRYGFWGLVYLEAVLRLADHRASEQGEEPGDGEAPPY